MKSWDVTDVTSTMSVNVSKQHNPIGSMYAIYGNIYHQYTPNVSIYTIHGSYGNPNTQNPQHPQHTGLQSSYRGTNIGGIPITGTAGTERISWRILDMTGTLKFKLHRVMENCLRVAENCVAPHLATLMFTQTAQNPKIERIWQLSPAVLLHPALTKAGCALPTALPYRRFWALDSTFKNQTRSRGSKPNWT